jgi:hypothetical protein
VPWTNERQYKTIKNAKVLEPRDALENSQSSFPKCFLDLKHFQHQPGLEEESCAASRNGEASLSFSYPDCEKGKPMAKKLPKPTQLPNPAPLLITAKNSNLGGSKSKFEVNKDLGQC